MSSDNLTSSRILSWKLGKRFVFASSTIILTSDRVLGELLLGSMIVNHLVRGPRYGPFREALKKNNNNNKQALGSF